MAIKASCRSLPAMRPLKRPRRMLVLIPVAGTWARSSAMVGKERLSEEGGGAVVVVVDAGREGLDRCLEIFTEYCGYV